MFIPLVATFMIGTLPIQAQQPNVEIRPEPTNINIVSRVTEIETTKIKPLKAKKIAKRSIRSIEPEKPVKTAVKSVTGYTKAGSGWYPAGQCTWYVSTRRAVGQWNNATDWLWQAKRDGWATGAVPRAGAIAWKSGHVAYVESVSGNMMTISEANYDYNGSIRTITIPISNYQGFIY